MPMSQLPTFLRVSELAEELSVSTSTVRRWLRAGVLPSVRVGRFRLVPREALQGLVDEAHESIQHMAQEPAIAGTA